MADVEINDLGLDAAPLVTDELEIQKTGGGSSLKQTILQQIGISVSADTPQLLELGSDQLLYVPDSPSDGTLYARQDGNWVPIPDPPEIPEGTATGQTVYWDQTAMEWKVDTTVYLQNDGTIKRSVFSDALTLIGGPDIMNNAAIELYGIGSAFPQDITFLADNVPHTRYDHSATLWDFGSLSLQTTGPVSVGEFTSTGINDDANAQAFQLFDSSSKWGQAGAIFQFFHAASDQYVNYGGGTGWNDGGVVRPVGGTNATNAGDIMFYSDGVLRGLWDLSLSQWDFQNNPIRTTGDITANAFFGDGSNLTGLVEEAPEDGMLYGRKDAAWEAIQDTVPPGTVDFQTLRWDNTGAQWVASGILHDGSNNLTVPGNSNITGNEIVTGNATVNGGTVAVNSSTTRAAFVATGDDGESTQIDSGQTSFDAARIFTTRNSLRLLVANATVEGIRINNGATTIYQNVTVPQALTVNGAFTSVGIDDNATEEVFEVADTFARMGGTSAYYTLNRYDATGTLNISGGSAGNQGGNIELKGQSAAGQESHINFRASGTTVGQWNNTSGQWNFFTNPVTMGNLTSTGIDDNATAERLQVADDGLAIGAGGTDYVINHKASDRILTVAGGAGTGQGANIRLFGQSHATQPNDMLFRANSVTTLAYDDANDIWDFQGNRTKGAGILRTSLTGTAYQLQLDDAGTLLAVSNPDPNTITVPANSTVAFPIGTRIEVIQQGNGQTTLVAGGTTQLDSKDGNLALAARYSGVTLTKIDTDRWIAVGDLA